MFHQPPTEFFYSAYLIKTTFTDYNNTVKQGLGTGFIIALNSNKPIIVTNRHVIDIDYRQNTPKYKDFRLQELTILGRRSDDSTYTFRLHPEARFFYDQKYENDVVLIEPRFFIDEPDKPFNLHWHFGIEHLADQNIYNSSLQPYDNVSFTGFPDQHDKLSVRPLLRSGKIASDPKYDYSWSDKFEGNCVAYEAFSTEGTSGSPVFAPARGLRHLPNSRHGYLVGVNAGHIPERNGLNTHSGISYFYKSTVILDIIKHSGLME